MKTEVIITIISLLIIAEGFFVTFFPKRAKKILAEMSRNIKKIRNYGIIEMIAGIILLIISIYLMS